MAKNPLLFGIQHYAGTWSTSPLAFFGRTPRNCRQSVSNSCTSGIWALQQLTQALGVLRGQQGGATKTVSSLFVGGLNSHSARLTRRRQASSGPPSLTNQRLQMYSRLPWCAANQSFQARLGLRRSGRANFGPCMPPCPRTSMAPWSLQQCAMPSAVSRA